MLLFWKLLLPCFNVGSSSLIRLQPFGPAAGLQACLDPAETWTLWDLFPSFPLFLLSWRGFNTAFPLQLLISKAYAVLTTRAVLSPPVFQWQLEENSAFYQLQHQSTSTHFNCNRGLCLKISAGKRVWKYTQTTIIFLSVAMSFYHNDKQWHLK